LLLYHAEQKKYAQKNEIIQYKSVIQNRSRYYLVMKIQTIIYGQTLIFLSRFGLVCFSRRQQKIFKWDVTDTLSKHTQKR